MLKPYEDRYSKDGIQSYLSMKIKENTSLFWFQSKYFPIIGQNCNEIYEVIDKWINSLFSCQLKQVDLNE